MEAAVGGVVDGGLVAGGHRDGGVEVESVVAFGLAAGGGDDGRVKHRHGDREGGRRAHGGGEGRVVQIHQRAGDGVRAGGQRRQGGGEQHTEAGLVEIDGVGEPDGGQQGRFHLEVAVGAEGEVLDVHADGQRVKTAESAAIGGGGDGEHGGKHGSSDVLIVTRIDLDGAVVNRGETRDVHRGAGRQRGVNAETVV